MAQNPTNFKIRLDKVRLSFPSLFERKKFDESDKSEGKFQASFLISKEDQEALISKIQRTMKACAEDKWGKGKVPKSVKYCLSDGDETDYDGYEGHMSVSSSNNKRVATVDRSKNPVTAEDDVLYAGCYVNAVITFWAQDNAYGKRINANLKAVQFDSAGESFGESGIDVDSEFDDLDGDEDSLLD